MVILRHPPARCRRGFASIDLFLAMAIFLVGFFSIAYLSTREMKLARAYYYDAIAMSLVDGELEVLAAGAWRELPTGDSQYRSPAPTMKSLPPGEFRATRSESAIRLEWIPSSRGNGRRITREFALTATSPNVP
jgi:hypothetical protein